MENHFGELLNAYSSNLVCGNQTIALSQYMFNMPLSLFNGVSVYVADRVSALGSRSGSIGLSSQILDLMQTVPHVQKLSLTGTRCEKIRRLDGDFKTRTYVEKCAERKRRKRKREEEGEAKGDGKSGSSAISGPCGAESTVST